MFLATRKNMDHICQHCGELIVGNAYRLRAKMKVSLCWIWLFAPSVLWRQNGFDSIRRKSMSEANKQLQLETQGVTVRDSAFNFNTRSS
jgi:hypothetical protein